MKKQLYSQEVRASAHTWRPRPAIKAVLKDPYPPASCQLQPSKAGKRLSSRRHTRTVPRAFPYRAYKPLSSAPRHRHRRFDLHCPRQNASGANCIGAQAPPAHLQNMERRRPLPPTRTAVGRRGDKGPVFVMRPARDRGQSPMDMLAAGLNR